VGADVQTSIVFDQRTWPGAGDVDDCWVVSALQAMNATSPWAHLVSVPVFRKAAGVPDHPHQADGGNVGAIRRGLVGCYPALRGLVSVFRGDPLGRLEAELLAGHPASVSIIAGKLPVPLRFGFTGAHQVTLAARGDRYLFANPLARPQSRWLTIDWRDVAPAIREYGRVRTGSAGAWAVTLPTDQEARGRWSTAVDATPYGQDDLDAATAALQARIDAARAALDGTPADG
jgi:hypothetical protein